MYINVYKLEIVIFLEHGIILWTLTINFTFRNFQFVLLWRAYETLYI